MSDGNQFDVLQSPNESKSWEAQARRGKDDIKEQAYQAREQVKAKAVHLKEQVLDKVSSGVETLKAKAGVSGKPNEEIVADAQETAAGEWETVKRKGKAAGKRAAEQIDEQLDEKLTPQQKAQLKRGLKSAQRSAISAERQAEGWSQALVGSVLRGPQLRPVKSFILRNNLSLPIVILGSLMTIWLGLTIIRLLTDAASPKVPEFDIHDKDASMAWLKYHAGEYKGKALDAKENIAVRAAAFLANHKWEDLKGDLKGHAGDLKDRAIDYREIGMKKLGLSEPTWGEWAWAKLTGRPISWQDRVDNVLNLARDGINRADLKASAGGLFDKVKGVFLHEPTVGERAQGIVDDLKHRLPGHVEPTWRDRLQDGIDTLRSHLPGGESIEAAKQRAYEATHQSTLDQIKSGATYVKNRIVHGAQEAAHIAQDRANEAADKAKYKAGL